MVSKNKLKYIKALAQKKHRIAAQAFLVEGEKLVLEAIAQNWEIVELFGTTNFLEQHSDLPLDADLITECSDRELGQMGQLSFNSKVAALVKMEGFHLDTAWDASFSLFLDGINDPGNLGTLIRTANWFGIQHIICGDQTVDCYNSKVIQASMGALFSTALTYVDNATFFSQTKAKEDYVIVGAELAGIELKNCAPISKGCLVMGSESHGLSKLAQEALTLSVTIPMGKRTQMESLNVGVAAGIICHQISPYL